MPVTWQSPHEVNGLSETLRDWLLNTGSLTERLQALTTNLSVNLLGQAVHPMDTSERVHLGNNKPGAWQIREVILQGIPAQSAPTSGLGAGLQDWVFARSVLPNDLCHSKWANLGNQPLGSRIFNDDHFVRSEFEIGQLSYHPIDQKPFSHGQVCWARRSKFTIDHYELLVAEAFLPDSPCYR